MPDSTDECGRAGETCVCVGDSSGCRQIQTNPRRHQSANLLRFFRFQAHIKFGLAAEKIHTTMVPDNQTHE